MLKRSDPIQLAGMASFRRGLEKPAAKYSAFSQVQRAMASVLLGGSRALLPYARNRVDESQSSNRVINQQLMSLPKQERRRGGRARRRRWR